jgi:hypothetical protein
VSHPLIQLASDREVRQAAGFRKAASRLSGEALAQAYSEEESSAPRLHEAGRRYLVNRSGRPASERKRNKDEEHLGAALVRHCAERGAGLELPDEEGPFLPLDYQVRVKTGPLEDPATKGIGRIDLLGLGPADRLVVSRLRYVEPSGTRCGVGDTPLRALLEGLAYCAIASANREEIAAEIGERFHRKPSDERPMLVVLASQRYWELCRKREAQKGAAWIKEMDRLAEEIGRDVGVPVRYLALRLEGDPGWSYGEQGPVLSGPPRLFPAWEPGAGRVRPKPKPRPKTAAPAEVVVEADPSRPVRTYALTDTYAAGDRIEHPTLGTGVVQGIAGPGKIRVRFDERVSLLVHDRGDAASSP